MDLQLYYQKIRETETKIADEFPLVVSLETPDGGKGGTKTEVPRRLAAKLLVEGQVRLATKDELKAYRESLAEAKRLAEQAAAAAKLQLTVLSTDGARPAAERGAEHQRVGGTRWHCSRTARFEHRRSEGARHAATECGHGRGHRRDTEAGAGAGRTRHRGGGAAGPVTTRYCWAG